VQRRLLAQTQPSLPCGLFDGSAASADRACEEGCLLSGL